MFCSFVFVCFYFSAPPSIFHLFHSRSKRNVKRVSASLESFHFTRAKRTWPRRAADRNVSSGCPARMPAWEAPVAAERREVTHCHQEGQFQHVQLGFADSCNIVRPVPSPGSSGPFFLAFLRALNSLLERVLPSAWLC